jgi:hypothetical protein
VRRQRKNLSKYRSSLEEKVTNKLKEQGVSYEYETVKLKYEKKPSVYTPDILLSNGIIIEIKGYFDAADRAKHLLIKDQHPDIDLRFVFDNSNKKIHKNSKTTYADWCHKHGFLFHDKEIPMEWVLEKTSD